MSHTAGYEMGQKSVPLSVGTPLCPYGIAYRRVYALFSSGLPKTTLGVRCVGQGERARERERGREKVEEGDRVSIPKYTTAPAASVRWVIVIDDYGLGFQDLGFRF